MPGRRELCRDVAMVSTVYGRFKPDGEERERWKRIVAARGGKKVDKGMPIARRT